MSGGQREQHHHQQHQHQHQRQRQRQHQHQEHLHERLAARRRDEHVGGVRGALDRQLLCRGQLRDAVDEVQPEGDALGVRPLHDRLPAAVAAVDRGGGVAQRAREQPPELIHVDAARVRGVRQLAHVVRRAALLPAVVVQHVR